MIDDPGRVTLCYMCIATTKGATRMLAIRLPKEIEDRLDKLARKTGRTKTYYAREAILEYLDDMEDYFLAASRLARNLRGIPLEEVERRLALED